MNNFKKMSSDPEEQTVVVYSDTDSLVSYSAPTSVSIDGISFPIVQSLDCQVIEHKRYLHVCIDDTGGDEIVIESLNGFKNTGILDLICMCLERHNVPWVLGELIATYIDKVQLMDAASIRRTNERYTKKR